MRKRRFGKDVDWRIRMGSNMHVGGVYFGLYSVFGMIGPTLNFDIRTCRPQRHIRADHMAQIHNFHFFTHFVASFFDDISRFVKVFE
jgi:hypothetical protein